MATATKPCFSMHFLFFLSSPTIIQSLGFYKLLEIVHLVLINISSRHSNLDFAHHFVIYWLLQNGTNKNQHQELHQRETIHDKFVIFAKLVRQKKSVGWAKYVYLCKWDMCQRNFLCLFAGDQKNVKSRSKIAFFFFKWAPFWNLFSKNENYHIFEKEII